MPNLRVNFCGQEFRNPVITASGTSGNGREFSERDLLGAIGGFTTKAVSLEPRLGNPAPRMKDTPSGVINAIGLQNPGVKHFLEHDLPFLRASGTPFIVNICGKTAEEYAALAAVLESSGVDWIEVNISCPNVEGEGMLFGQDPSTAAAVVRAVKGAVKRAKIIVKLTPNVTSIAKIARAVEMAGADAISLINTLKAMDIDAPTGKFLLSNKTGGLSGPAIFPVALGCVWQVAQTVEIPLIGMGGVSSGEDVVKMMRAGATLVAVGTANFYDVDNRTHLRIIEELKQFCERYSIPNLADLIGKTI